MIPKEIKISPSVAKKKKKEQKFILMLKYYSRNPFLKENKSSNVTRTDILFLNKIFISK